MERIRDVEGAVPYSRRYSGFVGVDIYDDPHGKDVCFLSNAFNNSNARHSRTTGGRPYGNRDMLRIWVTNN